MRLADRPVCTQAVEIPRPSADRLSQADNDIDGHDLPQFPDSPGVVDPRATSAGEPVSSRPGRSIMTAPRRSMGGAVTGGIEGRIRP
jgi:hypothetical protein